MATVIKMPTKPPRPAAQVDFLVDENGERITVPPDSAVQATGASERAVGATSPAAWWKIGLVVLGVVALALLVLQLLGEPPGTVAEPGLPVAAPQSAQ